jgi:copper chaperone CopZ
MAGEVNLEAKTLIIEYDPAKTGLKDIIDAIENAGFSVID